MEVEGQKYRLSLIHISFCGYTVEGGSIAVGKASTDSVVSSSVLILFADLILTKPVSYTHLDVYKRQDKC